MSPGPYFVGQDPYFVSPGPYFVGPGPYVCDAESVMLGGRSAKVAKTSTGRSTIPEITW